MPYCQQFKAEIQEWEKELEEAKVLLGEYLEGGEEERVGEVREKLKMISLSKDEFLKHYSAIAKKMMENWYLKFSPHEKMAEHFTEDITETGRVVSEQINFNTKITYIPQIIKKVNGYLNLDWALITHLTIEEIGGSLSLGHSLFQQAPRLKSIAGSLSLQDVNIENFRKAFPSLREIGIGSTGICVALSTNQKHLEEEIKQQVKNKTLRLAGEIVIFR